MSYEESVLSEASSSRNSTPERQPVVFPMEEDTGAISQARSSRGCEHPATRSLSLTDYAMPATSFSPLVVTDMSVFANEQRIIRLGENSQCQLSRERQPTPIPNSLCLSHTPEQQHRVFVPTNLSYYHQYSPFPVDGLQKATEMDDLAKSLSRAHIAVASTAPTPRSSILRQGNGLDQEADPSLAISASRSLDERRIPQLWKDCDNMSL